MARTHAHRHNHNRNRRLRRAQWHARGASSLVKPSPADRPPHVDVICGKWRSAHTSNPRASTPRSNVRKPLNDSNTHVDRPEWRPVDAPERVRRSRGPYRRLGHHFRYRRWPRPEVSGRNERAWKRWRRYSAVRGVNGVLPDTTRYCGSDRNYSERGAVHDHKPSIGSPVDRVCGLGGCFERHPHKDGHGEQGRGQKRKTKLVIIIIMELFISIFMGPSLQA